ncbi:hypothetical protein [Microlunatus sp. Y2014]|uniref:hypothetical protein n=1 Tax=Microlunatus sp. Y2014 TaxID=3418488 RepID=UPI003DA71996
MSRTPDGVVPQAPEHRDHGHGDDHVDQEYEPTSMMRRYGAWIGVVAIIAIVALIAVSVIQPFLG